MTIRPHRAGIVRVLALRSTSASLPAADALNSRDFSWALADEPDCSAPSPATADPHGNPQRSASGTDVARWEVQPASDGWRIATGQLIIAIRRDPCRISFHSPDGELLSGERPERGMTWCGESVQCWRSLQPREHVFGLGERGMPLDKRGTTVVNWNTDDFDHGPWSDPLYQSHPFFLSWRSLREPAGSAGGDRNRGRAAGPRGVAYGIFFDNTFRSWFDLGKTDRAALGFGADGGPLDYYFIPGPTPRDVLRRYAALVGATSLPPLWALGYQQCRWSYESEQRIRKIARQFRRRRIPCDTLYLDIDYMDEYRCFTWNPRTFRNPARLMRDLAGDGFKVVTIVDPGIKVDPGYSIYESGLAGDHFCRDADGKHYVGKVWPGESLFPDFTRAATRQWWGDQYHALTSPGVRGFWNDMNEPADFAHADKTIPLTVRFDGGGRAMDHREAHNLYGMQMSRATCEGLRRIRPDERPFVLTRAGFSGVQRYAAVWTGDNASSWEHLAMSVPMLLNLGLSGVAFCGADIGGFRDTCSAELYTRWLQLGIFYPLCRTHTAGGPEQDPWSYGVAHERINRRTIELRYRLLPYLYTEMHHACRTGEPVMRALLLDFPDHPDVHKAQYEFMFGRQLLVTPVLREGVRTRPVCLPQGDWYLFDPGSDSPCQRYEGRHIPEKIAEVLTGRTVAATALVPVRLTSIPLFARAGAVLPLREVLQFADERPLDELVLEAFPGDGGGCFYNDDGISYGYERGEFVWEQYSLTQDGSARLLKWEQRRGQERFCPRAYLVRFHGVEHEPREVLLGRTRLPPIKKSRGRSAGTPGWSYLRASKSVCVRIERPAPGADIEVRLRAGRRPAPRRGR